MFLPNQLFNQLDQLLSNIPLDTLQKAATKLSQNYRNLTPAIHSSEERLAYAAFRLPATYAVLHKLFFELKMRLPHENFQSFLDVGCGPGTAVWAIAEHFYNFQATLIDTDLEFLNLAKKLTGPHFSSELKCINDNFVSPSCLFPLSDLILFSYSLNEISEDHLEPVLQKAMNSVKKCLLIVEPGTPKGFERILKMRTLIARSSAFSLLAPCPQAGTCPLQGSSDWCHFYQRVERSFWHQRLKFAELPFEDEKFCYLLFSKIDGVKTKDRLLEKPQKRSGHIHFKSCRNEGIYKAVASKKKDPDLYPRLRKSEWGDDINSLINE